MEVLTTVGPPHSPSPPAPPPIPPSPPPPPEPPPARPPQTPSPAVPWRFFHQERLSGLGIDTSPFNVKCYDRAVDSRSTGTWHAKCKYHGPTILLLELTNDKVLGAYLSKPLTDVPTVDDYGNQIGYTQRNAWISDSSAFLFSLPPEGVLGDALKLPVQRSGNAFYEIPASSA